MYEQKPETIGQFDLRAFGSDVLVYSAGNILLLVFGSIQTFVIPKYLSVEGYGYWQLFMLYAAYVGILHLGFISGIYVRWAGKELGHVGGEIKTAFCFLLLEQVIVVIPLGLLLYFLLQPTLRGIALIILAYAFIYNLAAFFMFTAMSIRKFKLLTAINVGQGLAFLLLVIPLLVSGYTDYNHVIFAFLAALLLALSALTFWFRKYLRGIIPPLSAIWAYGKQNINSGIFVYFASIVLVLFLTVDRLIVSSFFSIEQFAIYALALTVAMIAYTFIGAVSQVFFPHLSASGSEARARTYHLAKPAIIIAWAAALAVYFPLNRLVAFYLPQYADSLPIMQILFLTVGFVSLIQILHFSYYMVYRKQRQYFFWGLTALALSVILNLLAIRIWGTLESVAIARLVSFGIWYITNEIGLRSAVDQNNRELWKSLSVICCYLGAFWLVSFLNDRFIVQMLIYIAFFLLLTWFFLSSEVRQLVSVAVALRRQLGEKS